MYIVVFLLLGGTSSILRTFWAEPVKKNTLYLNVQVNTFHEQRVKDIKSSHQVFLQEQIKFYQKVHTKVPMLNIVYLCCRSQKGCKRH